MTAVPTGAHPGTLPPVHSLLDVQSGHSVVSSVQIAGDGALCIRLYEAAGKEDSVCIRAPFEMTKAVCTDLDEREIDILPVNGREIVCSLSAFSICQLKLYR